MRKYAFSAALIGYCISAACQPILSPFSKVYTGITACSRQFTDAFSFQSNQAALAHVKEMAAGIYSEQTYELKETAFYSCSLVVPATNGGFGFSFNYSGDHYFQYRESSVAYGRRLGKGLDLGAAISYTGAGIAGYGSAGTLNEDIGLILRIDPSLNAGVHFSGVSGNRIASAYTMGISYEPSGKLLVKFEVSKEDGQPPQVITAIHYEFRQQVILRSAIVSGTGIIIMGAGFRWKNLRVDLSVSWHPQLGVTPGLMIMFTHSKKDLQ